MTGRELRRHAYRRVRGRLALAAGSSVLGNLTAVALPLAVARAVDDGLAGGRGVVAAWCLLVLILGAAGGVFRLLEQRIGWLAGADAVAEVREMVSASIVRRPPPLERGELISRIHRDGDLLWEWLSGRAEAPGLLAGVVATLVAVTSVDPALTTIALGALAGAAAVARIFPGPFERRSQTVSQAHGRFAQNLDALAGGLSSVRGLGAAEVLVGSCRESSRLVAGAARRLGRLGATWRAATAAVPMLGGAAGLVVGSFGVIDGRLGVGGVIAFSAWMVILSQHSVALVHQYQARRAAAASSARLAELLAGETGDIEARLLRLPGEWVAERAAGEGDAPLDLRVGPHGAVEVTAPDPDAAARLLTGEREPASGTVRYSGHPVADIPPGQRAAVLRRAPQHPVLVSGTIADNVALGRTTDRGQMLDACRVAGLLDEIEALPEGFETVLGDRGQGLSGGQRQRLGLARSLLGSPPALVLDDALSALDRTAEEAVRKALRRAAPATVLLSVRRHEP